MLYIIILTINIQQYERTIVVNALSMYVHIVNKDTGEPCLRRHGTTIIRTDTQPCTGYFDLNCIASSHNTILHKANSSKHHCRRLVKLSRAYKFSTVAVVE